MTWHSSCNWMRKVPFTGGRSWPFSHPVATHPPGTGSLPLGGNIRSHLVFPDPWHRQEGASGLWLISCPEQLNALPALRLQCPWKAVTLMNRIKLTLAGYFFRVGDTADSEKDCEVFVCLPICVLPPSNCPFTQSCLLNEAGVTLHRQRGPEMQISITTTAWIPRLWVI